MKHYATYLRVSTQKQGRSGLGLDAQRKMCADFVAAHDGTIAKEFSDIESGTHRDRKGLQDAIAYCKSYGCPLVIAKLDRLARDVEFCFKVVNTGIEIHFTDMQQMNTLLLGVFASVAQYERELTSERTKKALAVKKSQGCKLGAASDKYRARVNAKSEEEIAKEAKKRGNTTRKKHQASRDTAVLLKVFRRVYADYCKDDNPAHWRWAYVTTAKAKRVEALSLLRDYKEMDGTGELLRSWDLTGDLASARLQTKLANSITSLRRSFVTY